MLSQDMVGQPRPERGAAVNPDSKQPNMGIDLVRAVAIGLVLGLHFFRYTHAKFVSGSKILRFTAWLFGHGYYGVTIFFVVSGFLIAISSFERTSSGHLRVRPYPYLRQTRDTHPSASVASGSHGSDCACGCCRPEHPVSVSLNL